MNELHKDYFLRMEKACGSLLHELQVIWDEIGESFADRERVLKDLENECVEAHQIKLDKASHLRAHLHQSIADAEAELAAICSAMGEKPVNNTQINQIAGSLKSEVSAIVPLLEEMRNRRAERIGQFLEVTDQIRKITIEIRAAGCNQSEITFDESELTTRKLEELHKELQSLQKEKSERLKMVMGQLKFLNSLCIVLGLEFEKMVAEVHPTLDEGEESKNISDDVVDRLASTIQRLREVKIQRMKKLQNLATSLLELWDLMDVPIEEQQLFQNITRNVAASEHELNEPNILSVDFLKSAEAEVSRLEKLKASKRKDIVLKKKFELDELRRKTHLLPEDGEINFALEAVEAGTVNNHYSLLMEQIDNQISLVKEDVLSRKDILEKVEKWLNACEEENWLEEYSKDENRYNAGRGAHLALKRAEKARAIVNKIPAMIHNLSDKITMWERERRKVFTYDGVSLHLMLEKYNVHKMEKAQEIERQKEQKKLYKQMVAKQELRYGSKPSPVKCQNSRKGRGSIASHKRLSLGGAMSEPPRVDDRQRNKTTPSAKKTKDRLFFSPDKRSAYCSPSPTKLRFNDSTPRRPELPRQPFSQLPRSNNIISAPPKMISGDNSASRTPILMPVQMQVGPTPPLTPVKHQLESINAPDHVIEYSFEERRLACYLAAHN
ncbi:microtubule-associated protein 3 isoform X2 [Carex littledalei]|uniref:Microtubule-associated protein 3 isoform X2 n=1 Tax=Carex littledalei TaxID=544730 RepID=A0A833VS72_9POAL|nr:microtubule-associated protein 3 isoform X2 [Carex littledalei]